LAWEGLPNYKSLAHIESNLFPQYFFIKKIVEAGVKDISISGTCLEYGNKSGCLTEDMPSNPQIPYSVAKDCQRKLVEQLQDHFDFQLKWARLFYVYGQEGGSSSLISKLVKAVSEGDSSFDMSWGEQIRDFIPVNLAAQYIASISVQDRITGVINCCSGNPITVKKFVESYVKEKGLNIKLNFGALPYPEYEPMAFWGDNQKLMMAL
jgi:dTDP-6-deoxy-L-talose 4-dehydrogenase (NAD+)